MDNSSDFSKLNYPGELTLEALATLDKYIASCCNASETSRRLKKKYTQVRHYLKQPYVRELFQMYLMRRGITPEKLVQDMARGLEATNGVYFQGRKVADEINWLAREKYLHLALEIFEVLKYVNKVDINQNQDVKILVSYNSQAQSNAMEDNER